MWLREPPRDDPSAYDNAGDVDRERHPNGDGTAVE